MKAHDALTEVNDAMAKLRAVRDTLGKHLAENSCESNETKQMSELHDRVASAISAYRQN